MKRLFPLLMVLLLLIGCTSQAPAQSGQPQAETDPSGTPVPREPAPETTEDPPAKENTVVLTFSSFDGGGYEYSVSADDPEILSWTVQKDYGLINDEPETGGTFDVSITFTGRKPGTTQVAVYGRSPILENDDSVYSAVVDDELRVTLTPVTMISTLFLYRSGDVDYNTYSITMEQDGYYVSVNDEASHPIDADAVEALGRIVAENDVAAWDGFEESGQYDPDGESFRLEIQLTDGTYIMAQGENVYPENYHPVIDDMQKILDDASGVPN